MMFFQLAFLSVCCQRKTILVEKQVSFRIFKRHTMRVSFRMIEGKLTKNNRH
jgi:hypothetical protein